MRARALCDVNEMVINQGQKQLESESDYRIEILMDLVQGTGVQKPHKRCLHT